MEINIIILIIYRINVFEGHVTYLNTRNVLDLWPKHSSLATETSQLVSVPQQLRQKNEGEFYVLVKIYLHSYVKPIV